MLFSRVVFALVASSAWAFEVEFCFTEYCTVKEKHVPTHTVVRSLTVTKFTTSTDYPSTTVTPTTTTTVISTESDTTTVTESTVTATQTSTAFTTSTETDTLTHTRTHKTTVTETDFNTYYIAASSGFTPLASVAATDGGMPSKRRRNVVDRNVLNKHVQPKGLCAKPNPHHKRYPKDVKCYEIDEKYTVVTITNTAPVTTITASPEVTDTDTSTVTVTMTDFLNPSTSTTVTSTSTIPTTTTKTTVTTTTSTSTATFFTGQTSIYAACATNNLISNYAPGQAITNGYSDYDNYVYGDAYSAFDCCNQCVSAGPGCGGFFYVPTDPETCIFWYTNNDNDACDATASDGYLVTNDGSDPGTAGNSNCGQLRFFS